MAKFDMRSDLSIARSANLTVANNTQSTAACDMQGYEALTVLVNTNTVTAFGAGITFKLQESDSLVAASFTDVAAGDVIGSATAVGADTDDDVLRGTIGYRGGKRYVRAQAVGSASANAAVNFFFIRGRNSSVIAPVTGTFTLTATT
jgi:hypothetical protein